MTEKHKVEELNIAAKTNKQQLRLKTEKHQHKKKKKFKREIDF